MQNTEGRDSESVFVVEACQDCKSHQVNTWHDEAKYQEFYNRGKRGCWAVLISLGEEGDSPWPSRLLQHVWLTFSFVFSVECHRWARSKLNHHEKPDSKVIPASRLVLQPDPQWRSQLALLPASASHRRFWGFLQWHGKQRDDLNFSSNARFLFYLYS